MKKKGTNQYLMPGRAQFQLFSSFFNLCPLKWFYIISEFMKMRRRKPCLLKRYCCYYHSLSTEKVDDIHVNIQRMSVFFPVSYLIFLALLYRLK